MYKIVKQNGFSIKYTKIPNDGINVPSNFLLQLRGPATALSRKFLHDLTTAGHFEVFFCNVHNRNIYNEN
jgi:hypothetical protein